ncbi:aminotransferase class V [Anaeromyxobacter dehalogenans 2CP-1]|uniref:Aminotransferase class V n=1 Tax=Anaeromyxobacter dehalogenans (strain ATCC BAA-258 / DSM 21875 / 2CP-1) TaxID=455488 RepID=B8JFT2_ANAD2|nr:cysteine desulfurase family protein [Anaeromyxobacter dehalogenans]ACL64520.1 aminotransferase class V [Anaeromyxobacter dehalogenans 2CP-1]
MIYLDHNAITPMRPDARAAVRDALEVFGNPSSVHAAGRAARDLLDCARDRVARAVGAAPAEIVFTSGATESAALAIRGVLGAAPAGRRRLVVTAVEHPCVLSLARALERAGTPLTVVPVDRRGQVDPEAFRAALGPDVALACAMRANNETGVVLPVPALAAAARDAGAPFFCDAVQAAGKIPLDVRGLGADLVALTGQKFGGPRGAGVLWVAPGLRLAPVLGGEQERGRRAGTENLPGIAGLATALEAAVAAVAEEGPRLAGLRDRLEAGLLAAVPRARVNGAGAPRLPGTLSITFEGCDAEALLMAMDLEGVCASAGSACHSGSTRPSGVLLALGLSDADARATLRLSLGWTTTAEDVDAALRIVPPLVARVRGAIAGSA